MTIQGGLAAKFRFLRVNPFRGLLIDEYAWADAHDYHRNQMRAHLMALHGVGVVQGLEVFGSQPPDLNVVVRPGLAIDSEGRMLFLAEQQTVEIPPNKDLATIFIVLEYNEKVTQTQNVADGGKAQVARVLEEAKVRATLEFTAGAVELARVNLQPGSKQVRNAANPLQPQPNELDVTGRRAVAGQGAAGGGGSKPRVTITVGMLRYGPPDNQEWKRHSEGLRRLLRDTSANTNLDGNLLEGVNMMDEATLRNCRMLYLNGRSVFRLSPEEEQGLRRFLDRGGILWCEPCRSGLQPGVPDDFSRSCIELAQRLNRQPLQPRPGHPIFTSRYLFAAPPIAVDPAGVVVEANRMLISTGDYGCLWEGRGQERVEPPPREILRSAQEFGANVLFLAAGAA